MTRRQQAAAVHMDTFGEIRDNQKVVGDDSTFAA